jgi:hypothetical protein
MYGRNSQRNAADVSANADVGPPEVLQSALHGVLQLKEEMLSGT